MLLHCDNCRGAKQEQFGAVLLCLIDCEPTSPGKDGLHLRVCRAHGFGSASCFGLQGFRNTLLSSIARFVRESCPAKHPPVYRIGGLHSACGKLRLTTAAEQLLLKALTD